MDTAAHVLSVAPPMATGTSLVQDRLYGLLSMPVFAGVRTDKLQELAQRAQWIELAPGEELGYGAAEGTSVVMIVEGAVDAHLTMPATGDKDIIVGRGSVIGRVPGGRRYTDSMRLCAITPSLVMRLDASDMVYLCESGNPAGAAVEMQLERMLL